MRRKLLVVLGVAVGLLVVTGPTFAHHSRALYDTEHPVTLKGTVTEYAFVNPHVEIRFDVKDQTGNVSMWTAESAAPQKLSRAGWTKTTLKPGDAITVTGYPLKDGRHIMSVRRIIAPGDKVLTEGTQ